MAKLDRKDDIEVSHEDFLAAAKSALVFCGLFILTLLALWGYVYSILLERGMTQ
jgi:hypothetical protein